jgi:hypothetical protein
MQIVFDVVDLLQLQEIWSRRPVVTAFTRLETRQTALPSPVNFNIDELLPRLMKLKLSPIWRLNNKTNKANDPARIPLRDLSEEYLCELFPESISGAAIRQLLFHSAYSRFVVAHYSGDVEQARKVLQALAQIRQIAPEQCLDEDHLPRSGSPEWIPADITDDIRSLDERYDPTQVGLPATFVISDQFWPLLVKATPEEIDQSARLSCSDGDTQSCDHNRRALTAMNDVAYAWNRSPSVVGLCYQVADASLSNTQ